MTTKKINITVLADDFAYGYDKIFKLLKNDISNFKVIISESNKVYRCYVDAVITDNDIGKIENVPENIDDILNQDYSIKITKLNSDDDRFNAELIYIQEKKIKTVKVDSIPEKFSKMIDSKISDGVLTELKPVLEARVRYMIQNHVHEDDIRDVINYWDANCINESGTKIPTYYVDPNLETSIKQNKSGIVSKAIQAYLIGNPKILKGPKSTGKNTLINSIVWLFGDKMEEHTFSIGDSISDVISSEGTDNSAVERMRTISTSLLAEAEKIKIEHSTNPSLPYSKKEDQVLLAEALFKQLSAEAGSVHIIHEYRGFARWLLDTSGHTCYVADEINMADANLLVALLHPILDGSIREFDLPGRGKIPMPKHLMMFGTENVGYSGEQESNSATKSRFGAFELGQPESILGILHSAVSSGLKKIGITDDLNEKYYKQAEDFYFACKKAAQSGAESNYGSGEISDQVLNVRGIVRAMIQTKRFFGRTTLNECLEAEVVCPCDDEERPMLNALLNKIVTL